MKIYIGLIFPLYFAFMEGVEQVYPSWLKGK